MGELHVRPTPEVVHAYSDKVRFRARRQAQYAALRTLPPVTLDGQHVSLNINAGLVYDLPHLDQSGAEGIGLFRSEWFLTRNRGQFPTEDAQYRVYRAMAEQMKPWSVIVRAFDLSADQVGEDAGRPEANPALGLRAIRLLLKRRDLFKEQLRALLFHENVAEDASEEADVPAQRAVDLALADHGSRRYQRSAPTPSRSWGALFRRTHNGPDGDR